MKNQSSLHIGIRVLFLILLLTTRVYFAQAQDTIPKLREDIELIKWTENYIVKTGYMEKNKKGYRVPLSNSFSENLKGWYSLDIIEKHDYDTAL